MKSFLLCLSALSSIASVGAPLELKDLVVSPGETRGGLSYSHIRAERDANLAIRRRIRSALVEIERDVAEDLLLKREIVLDQERRIESLESEIRKATELRDSPKLEILRPQLEPLRKSRDVGAAEVDRLASAKEKKVEDVFRANPIRVDWTQLSCNLMIEVEYTRTFTRASSIFSTEHRKQFLYVAESAEKLETFRIRPRIGRGQNGDEPTIETPSRDIGYGAMLYLADGRAFGDYREFFAEKGYSGNPNPQRWEAFHSIDQRLRQVQQRVLPYSLRARSPDYDAYAAEPFWQDAMVHRCSHARSQFHKDDLKAGDNTPSDNDWHKVSNSSLKVKSCRCFATDNRNQAHEALIEL